MIQHLLVPTDGSDNAERAVRFSTQVIDPQQSGEITVLYVHVPVPIVSPVMSSAPGMIPEMPLASDIKANEERAEAERNRAWQIVERAVKELRRSVPSSYINVSGRVVAGQRVDESILHVASETHAEIIVVGTHGVSALRGAILGSVSHALIAKAECPVLVVK